MTKGHVANYGLVDQMAALQWVVEAACVEYLVHSPMIRQSHFQRVILMSGSIFSGWARVDNPSEIAVKLAKELDCSLPADLYTHHTNILDCLRDKSVEQLTQVKLDTFAFKAVWGPSYDVEDQKKKNL